MEAEQRDLAGVSICDRPSGIVHERGTMLKPTLVVLAAGIGSRYGGLKQIDPIGPSGEIILDYSIYDALRAGFGRVVFVISAAIEKAFRDRVGRTIEEQCETNYVIQRLEDLPQGSRFRLEDRNRGAPRTRRGRAATQSRPPLQ